MSTDSVRLRQIVHNANGYGMTPQIARAKAKLITKYRGNRATTHCAKSACPKSELRNPWYVIEHVES